ncbi:MAG: hypothetical protein MZV64_43490 [Ignavibacteriales bacterium]|nr:hypothetical protein [Ignavibacteriales bacterium]
MAAVGLILFARAFTADTPGHAAQGQNGDERRLRAGAARRRSRSAASPSRPRPSSASHAGAVDHLPGARRPAACSSGSRKR